ncbi:MAG TPA: penicillin-binding transpeptidase domain-containing protein [Candidatus Rhabdochlamydia sp.]|nr:penicillin-binding transpeptidase domain-containing protein [Candidatus Rhabdochlamydia sp.]
MYQSLFSKFMACLLLIFPCVYSFSVEENFLLINGISDEKIVELGSHINERITPCSTFKMALSLMGYDAEVLKDEKTPTWLFQEGYDCFLESWKNPQTPQSWMKTSCIWFSRVLATQLGLENMQKYLASLEYGNQDISGGLTKAWLVSSLKISAEEQVALMQKALLGKLPISDNAIQMTKKLLFIDQLPEGWNLFGKTGWTGSMIGEDGKISEIGWFVGWIEKDDKFFPFSYHICEDKINLAQRIPRVKELLMQSHVMGEILHE